MNASPLLAMVVAAAATACFADAEKGGIIDTHFHAMSNQPGGLDQAVEWLDTHGVERAIDHPIATSRPNNDDERRVMLENFTRHADRFSRFCIITPEDVDSVEAAVQILSQEKKDGAIGFGEHYGSGLMFDDPANCRLYEACAIVGLPVMFHMDGKRNMDTDDLKHLENALRLHPQCTFIAHGPSWWKALAAGHCDRLLTAYPNLYADLSAASGARALGADMKRTAAFMVKHRKRLLFGTDCGWWSYPKMEKPAPQFALMKTLDVPDDVKADIYRHNACRLFGFK